MASKKNTMVRKDPNKKTNINRKLLSKIFGALEGVVVKGLEPVSIPFLQQKGLDKPIIAFLIIVRMR